MSTRAEIRAALEQVLASGQTTVELTQGNWSSGPLPAPLPNVRCPDHPTYPLIVKQGRAFCRRGPHFIDTDDG